MDDDEYRPRRETSPSPATMSKTPSWIMLGFVLGALFVVALPTRKQEPSFEEERARLAAVPKPEPPREPQPLAIVEAVFSEWRDYAVWSDGTTEVALWNSRYRDFTDYYEVRRVAGDYFFRTIPALTRRPLPRGSVPEDCPLRFTETEAQYREGLERGRSGRRDEAAQVDPAARRPRPGAVTRPAVGPVVAAPRGPEPILPALEAVTPPSLDVGPSPVGGPKK